MEPSSPHPLTSAYTALERLETLLPAASVIAMSNRLATWQRHLDQQQQTQVALPELVMRPDLPPRPLNKHYFTVVRSYD